MHPYNKNNAWLFQRNIKQSQLFETSHATAKTSKRTIKIKLSMTCKSLSHSLNKLQKKYVGVQPFIEANKKKENWKRK
jgi:hypothetical protein